jgi:hypothetical protein
MPKSIDRGEAKYHPLLNLTSMLDNKVKQGDIYFIQGRLLLATYCKQIINMASLVFSKRCGTNLRVALTSNGHE